MCPVTTSEDPQERRERLIEELFFKIKDTNVLDKVSLIDIVKAHSPLKKTALSRSLLVGKRIQSMKKKDARRKLAVNSLKKGSKAYKLKQEEVSKELKDWETKMNNIARGYDPAPIVVENKADLEGPPSNFIYINERKAGDNVDIPRDPMLGCECEDCYECRKTCCPNNFESDISYRMGTKRLKVPKGVPIYECNSRCKCGPECVNRVVQNGRQCKVCIFRTANGRGWGVKTMQKIKKGDFVMEYVGEVSI